MQYPVEVLNRAAIGHKHDPLRIPACVPFCEVVEVGALLRDNRVTTGLLQRSTDRRP
jgi:hypothetical protein